MEFFQNWERFSIENSSLDFYRLNEDGVEYIGFDCRKCVPPEPMVNAMLALNLVKDKTIKVVMINHKFPAGLIPKVEGNFNIERENLQGDEVKLTFSLKDGKEPINLDHTKTCHG